MHFQNAAQNAAQDAAVRRCAAPRKYWENKFSIFRVYFSILREPFSIGLKP
jgi:hypothetical protein